MTLKVRIWPFLTTFAQLSERLKNFLRGWLLVLVIKEGLVKCATVCVKSVVILTRLHAVNAYIAQWPFSFYIVQKLWCIFCSLLPCYVILPIWYKLLWLHHLQFQSYFHFSFCLPYLNYYLSGAVCAISVCVCLSASAKNFSCYTVSVNRHLEFSNSSPKGLKASLK